MIEFKSKTVDKLREWVSRHPELGSGSRFRNKFGMTEDTSSNQFLYKNILAFLIFSGLNLLFLKGVIFSPGLILGGDCLGS